MINYQYQSNFKTFFNGITFSKRKTICYVFIMVFVLFFSPLSVLVLSKAEAATTCSNTYEQIDTTWRATRGDFNGDGHQDLVYGYPDADIENVRDCGKIEVLYGPLYDCRESFHLGPPVENHKFGYSVAAGDIDNDGYSDVVVGLPGLKNDKGGIYVMFGSDDGLSHDRNQVFYQDSPGIKGDAEAGDQFGYSLAVGDFNNDEHDDVAIGVPGENDSEGWVNIIYGASSGLTANGDSMFGQDIEGIDGHGEPYDEFGSALASGDFNDDGYDDLAIGVPGEDLKIVREMASDKIWDNAGSMNIIYGSRIGLNPKYQGSYSYHQLSEDDIKYSESYRFASALASGDFDDDGVDDIAIGVPEANLGYDERAMTDRAGCTGVGLVTVIYGKRRENAFHFGGLLRSEKNRQFDQGDDIHSYEGDQGPAEGEHFGYQLTVGDFNQSGHDDLMIWVENEKCDCFEECWSEPLFVKCGDVEGEIWTHVLYGKDDGLLIDAYNRFEKQPWNPW